MKFKYQLILLGKRTSFESGLLDAFYVSISELGLDNGHFALIRTSNFAAEYKRNLPTFCLYFGSDAGNFSNLDNIEHLIAGGVQILPVVLSSKNIRQQIPASLRDVNAFMLTSKKHIAALVSCILEGLSLLRLSRRLFISYKGDESSGVAIQLFEELEKHGFDVFLDTHSIRPGEPFQDELWHRMADTDVVVLLNTQGFLSSEWTTQELAKANIMSIGILQLIWPDAWKREANLTLPFQLTENDFVNAQYTTSKNHLIDDTVQKIAKEVESLRARSLASRQANLITELISTSSKLRKKATLQPERIITVGHTDGKESILIPTIGVPQAFTYHQMEELLARTRKKTVVATYLLFDHRNIKERWLKHLAWLDNYLPIKTLRIVNAEEWLRNI